MSCVGVVHAVAAAEAIVGVSVGCVVGALDARMGPGCARTAAPAPIRIAQGSTEKTNVRGWMEIMFVQPGREATKTGVVAVSFRQIFTAVIAS